MSSSMKAAILDRIILRIWQCTRTRASRKSRILFGITLPLVSDHTEEILDVKPIESTASLWTRSRLSHRQVIKWTKAKVHKISDSVLCLWKLSDHSEANRRWESQVADFQLTVSYQELLGVDGEPIEFEWIFPRTTSLHILQEIRSDLRSWSIEPENF